MIVIGSDYDGTIRINAKVSEEDKNAINEFRKQGNKFGLVSGRSIESTKKQLAEHHFEFDFIVCNNGGVIFDHDLNLLKLSLIDFNTALDIIEFIKGYGCDSYVLNDGLRRAQKIIKEDYVDLHNSGEGSVSVETIIESKKVAQIVVGFNKQEAANELAKQLNEKFDGIEAYTNVNCVDIVPANTSKANGLKYIVEHYGYAKENTYGIGDSYNDVNMIEAFHGACLTHSPDDIKEISTYVVNSVTEFINILTK